MVWNARILAAAGFRTLPRARALSVRYLWGIVFVFMWCAPWKLFHRRGIMMNVLRKKNWWEDTVPWSCWSLPRTSWLFFKLLAAVTSWIPQLQANTRKYVSRYEQYSVLDRRRKFGCKLSADTIHPTIFQVPIQVFSWLMSTSDTRISFGLWSLPLKVSRCRMKCPLSFRFQGQQLDLDRWMRMCCQVCLLCQEPLIRHLIRWRAQMFQVSRINDICSEI